MSNEQENRTTGKVNGIIANLVIVQVEGPFAQNEICYIVHNGVRLMAEVIKAQGGLAYVQVFESTRGLRPGSLVEFSGHMLEVSLGPGLLSRNYDGLLNDLDTMTGVFLKRGEYTETLNVKKKWDFKPIAKPGDPVIAGDWLGEVDENSIAHRIMVPFKMEGQFTVQSVAEAGQYAANEPIAMLLNENGEQIVVTMVQRWPSKPTETSPALSNYWKRVCASLTR